MKLTHTLLTAALTLTCMAAAAQWQWLDKDGRKVFSDRAPSSDIPDKNILKRPQGRTASAPPADTGTAEPQAAAAPALPASAAKGAGVDKELEAKKKQAADAEVAKRKEEEARLVKAKIENCARAKQAKATYDSGVRVSRVTPNGEREILDDKARAEELKRIQGVIASDCK